MQIGPTPIGGVHVVTTEVAADERGHFARVFDSEVFAAAGLAGDVRQSSVSFNTHRHTLRGMHLQRDPHGESKLVRCSRGRLFDVVVDLRPDSPTYCQWFGQELDDRTLTALYIPPGVAHGFLTLEPSTEVSYQMATEYVPEAADGVRWDDPAFGIEWPAAPAVLSQRDAEWPDLRR